jgi:predicted 3-demethylubiquinone-9 3-methyltransferase (glyoxalase superfamily)
MYKKHVTALATTVLLAISGVAAGGAQAAPFDPAVPLSPVGHQLPLTPVSQQSAVRAATNYLSIMPFSHDGLVTQLTTGDGYSAADATFAVNSITVDWNEQAAKAANNYLGIMPFSHDGLITQLTTGDGYTYAQAVHGVAAVGL